MYCSSHTEFFSVHVIVYAEGSWNCACPGFGPQSFIGYLGLTLVFMWNSALREGFNFYFSRVLWKCYQIFVLPGGALGYHSMGFRHFPGVF